MSRTSPGPEVGSVREDSCWMSAALEQARQAEKLGEVPVGAVIVRGSECLARAHNRVIIDDDPTAHAEIVALRLAARGQGNYRLPGTTLYVTLEPCSMCAGAIVNARIGRVVYAAADPRTGAHRSVFSILDHPVLNHRCQVTAGVLADESSELLRTFFRQRR
jgi:tRNA(adenine34) deaminase